MSVALLLITHEHIAQGLLTIAHDVLDQAIENIAAIEVPMDAPVDDIKNSTHLKLSLLDTDEGLLILTDLIGSTPFNIAHQLLSENENATLVSGLNLPMLLKISNYRTLSLADLTEKAIIGGQNGITLYEQNTCS